MYLINYETLYEIPIVITPINKHTFVSQKVYFKWTEVLSAAMHLIEWFVKYRVLDCVYGSCYSIANDKTLFLHSRRSRNKKSEGRARWKNVPICVHKQCNRMCYKNSIALPTSLPYLVDKLKIKVSNIWNILST